MNRNALIATLIVFSFLCLGATAGDGFTSGNQGETQGNADWPTAEQFGNEEPYADIATVVEGDSSNDRCEDGLLPGELLRFLHYVRAPKVYIPGEMLDCEDRRGREIGAGVEDARESLD